MSPSHRQTPMADGPSVTSYGQVVEYIKDRLYLASYTHPPNENTPFPYPCKTARSPSKRSSKAQSEPQTAALDEPKLPPVYFSIDGHLLYNAFHGDFGPLHIGHLYRFAVQLHEVLAQQESESRYVVFWSNADSRSRANAACILATYMVLIQHWPPHLALAPIAQMDPPCMPFRDAGYSQADYSLTVQDVVYGVWKAKEENLVGLKEFSLDEYERFERVDMGDFNWITPSFLAFASPQHTPTAVIHSNDPLYAQLPRTVGAIERHKTLPTPFKNILAHFSQRGIGLVVRLNSALYSPSYFTAIGIKHLDMEFDDGTCPPLNLVRKFIGLAHNMIAKQKGIAVHCKAGLGRTGCLIGAYLIYKHGFTANECIAFMRFMRPGMVVGPQQHWLHLNQGKFREWWFEDTMKEKIAASMQPSTPSKLNQSVSRKMASNGQTLTPPNGDRQASGPRRSALGEITNNEQAATGGLSGRTSADGMKSSVGVADENLPAPTPGQPRKTSKLYSARKVLRENQPLDIKPDSEIVSMQRSKVNLGEDDNDADTALRMLGHKSSQSPMSRSGKRRAISCTTTTTTTTKWDGLTSDETSDAENRLRSAEAVPDMPMLENQPSPSRHKTPCRSGSGVANLSIGKRSSPLRRSTEGKTSVRKTSGRVGSVGTQPARPHRAS